MSNNNKGEIAITHKPGNSSSKAAITASRSDPSSVAVRYSIPSNYSNLSVRKYQSFSKSTRGMLYYEKNS